MSCKHGNWDDCELCEEIDALWEEKGLLEDERDSALKDREHYREENKKVEAENDALRELLRLIFESTAPYREDGTCVFTDQVSLMARKFLPHAQVNAPLEPEKEQMDAHQVMQEALCAMDNQDEPLENYPVRLIDALGRAGFAVVPVNLPYEVLGAAAMRGVTETGNPKHCWDYLLLRVRVA